jgi:hypothetical protein
MRLELLSVALRQRDPWEAMDLGIALWRRHFGAILRPWLGLSLPLFVLFGALAWSLDALWLLGLLMWWLKPWFDRVPIYVLSRAVFGTVPGTMQVLRARELRGPGLLGWLSWRRLHPVRALLLPIELLEGVSGARRSARAAVLQRAVGSQAIGLIATCAALEVATWLSLIFVGLMFVPNEMLSESARALWSTMFLTPPRWAQLLALALWWLSVCLVEPVYIAAGFGLYLNRRTQLEAWDVELVFRRLAARVSALASAAASLAAIGLLCAGLALPSPAHAQGQPPKTPPTLTQAQLLGEAEQPADPAFARALDRAYADPSLARTRKFTHWVLRTPLDRKKEPVPPPAWLGVLGWIVSAIAEYGLWILAGLLLIYVLWRLPRWLPWVRTALREEAPLPEVVEQALPEAQPLPDDVPAAASALWRDGRQRDALALLYRASVARLSARLDSPFPPGATEADCLRRARKLDDAQARASFNEVVRTWQRAAYARQFPDGEAFAALLSTWSQRFPVAA